MTTLAIISQVIVFSLFGLLILSGIAGLIMNLQEQKNKKKLFSNV